MGKARKGVTRTLQDKWYTRHRTSIDSGKYEPFWRVEDVKSSGIKVKVRAFNNPRRVVHLLSINELLMYSIIARDNTIVECYEQFALPLEDTLDIATELGVKHPVYPDTRIPIVQTIDFMCTRTNGTRIAFPVKEFDPSSHARTAEKLAIQEGYCAINDIDYQVVTSEELKTRQCENVERIYKHARLDHILKGLFKIWLENFIGCLADDRHERTAHIIERSAEITGVKYQRAVHFFYYALWHCFLIVDWSQPLFLEKAASDLMLHANDA